MGSNFTNEIDCGSFFDQIDDLIDFPSENDIGFSSSGCNSLPSIWTKNSEELPGPDQMFSGMKSNSALDLSAEVAVPYEDIVQLEWLSTFVEDSFSGGGMTLNKENIPANNEASNNQFRTSSPISVLESSSSSSSSYSEGKIIPLSQSHRGPQRARSKRPRPANFNPRSAMQFLSQSSAISDNTQLVNVPIISSESENFPESHHMKIPKPASEEKKKKPKLTFPKDRAEMNCSPPQQASVRKCLHCEITKTPQWRSGPLGPKTLCNACGVRYKSGRLFPEYRPAASPTFVPSLHSNSHKKVVEMRIKGGEDKFVTTPLMPTDTEMIPNASLLYM